MHNITTTNNNNHIIMNIMMVGPHPLQQTCTPGGRGGGFMAAARSLPPEGD